MTFLSALLAAVVYFLLHPLLYMVIAAATFYYYVKRRSREKTTAGPEDTTEDSLFDQGTEPAVVQPTEVPQDQVTELVKILNRILSDDRMKELEECICKALRNWKIKSKISGWGLDDIFVAVTQALAHGAVACTRSEVPSSQVNDEEEFSVGPWAAMKAEMGLDERNPSCFLHLYSVVMVLRKAASRQVSMNKVPNMAVVLKSILHTQGDAIAVFRDPTGEMQGTVHRRLLEERQGELKTGAVLLLKQVSVFSTSNQNHYLNVTPNNLLRIYPPDGAVHASSQHSQPALPEGGPISQEQGSIPAKPRVPANGVVQSATRPDCSEDAQWDADDPDELLLALRRVLLRLEPTPLI
ncbi:homologous recombination OB-fold protein isoform X1 [Ictalurus punctatus]|uniref:Homologous recombination OB-fold protein isoform X1 n=1 Tax=Ictalurus punctatus TaxID=7998 RepID=A0A9F7TG30_ICTPU|nr:homologous recombination OB-fold protein isoform X1 [Ictalurus punctatus]